MLSEPLLQFLILVIIIGFALWLLSKAPIDATLQAIARGVAILFVVIYLLTHLSMFGLG